MQNLIFLDTETTGLDPKKGHRIIEIAAIALDGRKVSKQHFHYYLDPEREVDEEAAREDEVSIAVQINGKVRDRITVAADASDETVQAAALAAEGVIRALEGKQPRKVIVVKGKLVSIVA